MEDMELICFQIISNSGAAKSNYIEAMNHARKFDFNKAEELIKEGKEYFLKAHECHYKLITKEASGEKVDLSLILMHAEDQLISADSFRIICEENIALMRMIKNLNEK